jgi:leucyl-tRNA synthetase
MILLNEISKVGKINHAEFKTLLTLLNPFAPHITEELWENCGFTPRICDVKWPVWEEDKLVKNEIEYAIQVNNKIIARLNIATTLEDKEIEEFVLNNDSIKNSLSGKNIMKVIVIKNRLVNIIAR